MDNQDIATQERNKLYGKALAAAANVREQYKILKATMKSYDVFMRQTEQIFPNITYAKEIFYAAIDFDTAVMKSRKAKDEYDALSKVEPDE